MAMELPKTFNCPKCGIAYRQLTATAVHYTCTCGNVNRIEGFLQSESNHKLKKLPLYSRFKQDSKGHFNQQAFTLTGALVAVFENAALNFWTMHLQDGSVQLLEEAYGFQTVLTPVTGINTKGLHERLNRASTTKDTIVDHLGTYRLVQQDAFWGFDVKGESAADIIGVEERFLLQSRDGETYIEIWLAGKECHIFKQEPVASIEALELSAFNPAIQFNEKDYADCASCGKEVYIPYFPLVKNFVCPHCTTLNKFTERWRWERDQKVVRLQRNAAAKIPLGTKLRLLGDDFKVIGATIKEDNQDAQWQEFTLYCETDGGFAFLSVFNGNFMLVYETMEFPLLPSVGQSVIYYEDTHYRFYNDYTTQLLWAEGYVFDDFASNNRRGFTYDYIAPPYLFSLERDGDKNNYWFRGEYVDRKELEKQQPPLELPKKTGLGTLEPASKFTSRQLIIGGALAAILFILVHLGIDLTGTPAKVVLSNTYSFSDTTKNIEITSETFELNNFRTNVGIAISSDVQNNWVSLNYALVNTETGQEYNAGKDLEYYSGYDGGESWSEGSNAYDHLFTAVPKGKYVLNIEAEKGTDAGIVTSLYVKAQAGSKRALNFWFPFIIILSWPVILLIRNYSREQERWA
ncbi:MAG: DUF4178 domain-containing protein [Sphingobacteriales bacterium]|nr:MAG: DUF4178 domain-containing protein [Sphingobacteriales bacterium]